MSLVHKVICPVPGCKFNRHSQYADIGQVKGHLKKDHDYKELQLTSFQLGLIDSINEKRGVIWFVDTLAEFSKVDK